jgi:hypothetical protein
MMTLPRQRRSGWLSYTSLDLRGISATRRHVYVYASLLLWVLLVRSVEQYQETAQANKPQAQELASGQFEP